MSAHDSPCVPAPQKQILKSANVEIPEGVTVTVKSRKLVVKGPRGELSKDLSHLPLDIKMMEDGKLRVERWFTSGKAAASIRTACSHIENMIIGVTKVRLSCRPALPASALQACGSRRPGTL